MTGALFYLSAMLVVGLLGAVLVNFTKAGNDRLTATEWVAGMAVVGAVIIPLVTFGVSAMAKSNAASRYEWISSHDTASFVNTVKCERDGDCAQTYQCAAYKHWVTRYRTEYYTTQESSRDANGNVTYRTVQRSRQVPYEVQETAYHSCPYVTEEYTYGMVDTSGEKYIYARATFPTDPSKHRWTGEGATEPRHGVGLPLLPNVPAGEPADWLASKASLAAGNPDGHTKQKKYDDFIRASEKNVYKHNRTLIDSYLSKNQLPKVATKGWGFNNAHKVYFVGAKPSNANTWLEALQRFNGQVGVSRGADLHIVLVNDNTVSDIDSYTDALSAYWRSEKLGDHTLGKNGIGLVLKVAGSEVVAARTFTSTPKGNEALIKTLNTSLPGKTATPEALLALETGSLWEPFMNERSGFELIDMKNYEYLYDSIEVGTGARIIALLVSLVLASGLWFLLFILPMEWDPVGQALNHFRKRSNRAQAKSTI